MEDFKYKVIDKWDDFKRWLDEDKAHRRIFSAGVMIAVALFILICFYGCANRADI
jgi:hypothetical protein